MYFNPLKMEKTLKGKKDSFLIGICTAVLMVAHGKSRLSQGELSQVLVNLIN